MFQENLIINLSQRYRKNDFFSAKNLLNGPSFLFIKGKKSDISDIYNHNNRSIDFLENKGNLIKKLKQLSDKKVNNKNKINFLKNSFQNKENSDNLKKKPFYRFFEKNVNKRILSKKKLMEKILFDKKQSIPKEKSRANSLNSKIIKLSKIGNKSNLFLSDSSINEHDINKIDSSKIKNQIFAGGGRIYYDNMTIINEKINMNKTALLKKIKFDSLKKFCKNIKITDKKIGYNFEMKKAESNKNEIRKNKKYEIKMNIIKEKVRDYFIGRFNSIKEYFEDWDENELGKIDINDITNYLNNKIKYKISWNETRELFSAYNIKNYLDLENFRIFFFDDFPKEKLILKGSKYLEYKDSLIKSCMELNPLNNINISESDCSVSILENYKYNKVIMLILQQRDEIFSQINKERNNLTFVEFYSIIRNVIKEKKVNFDKEIKRLFNEYKQKNSDLLNINDFFEELSIKKEENKKFHSLVNIRRHMYLGGKPFFNKNKNSFVDLSSRNLKNSFDFKDSNNQTKIKYIFDKITNKEEENKKNNIINFNYKFKNTNLNMNFKKDNLNSSKNCLKEKIYNDCASNENNDAKNQDSNEISKIINLKLPNINRHERNKNRNSDIMEFLNS